MDNNADKGSDDYGASFNKSSNVLFTYATFRLGVGKGRIEHVEDARQAMYILSDLQNNKSLKRTLTKDEVNALAQQMTAVKYKRQFDSRIKLIQEITTIDSFLVANDYIDKTNSAPYFTSLYDNWLYAGLIERLSGTRFSVGLTPAYSFQQVKVKDESSSSNIDDKFISSYIKGGIYANYAYEKPVNLYWQRSAGIGIQESYGQFRNVDDPFWETNLYASFKMGYYPNSRTYMTGSINQSLNWLDQGDLTGLNSFSSVAFNMYYYLSPQLRLSADCSLNYSYYKHQNGNGTTFSEYNKYPNLSFNFGLTYSIF